MRKIPVLVQEPNKNQTRSGQQIFGYASRWASLRTVTEHTVVPAIVIGKIIHMPVGILDGQLKETRNHGFDRSQSSVDNIQSSPHWTTGLFNGIIDDTFGESIHFENEFVFGLKELMNEYFVGTRTQWLKHKFNFNLT